VILVGEKYDVGLYHMRECSSREEEYVGGRSFRKSGTYLSNMV
jgi:hypothetical protein